MKASTSKRYISKVISLLPVLFLYVISCVYHSPEIPPEIVVAESNGQGCDPSQVYYEQDIQPILISNCTKSGCHNDKDRAEGISYSSYSQTIRTGKVRAGNPSGSKMYTSLTDTGEDRMPQGASPLPTEQIALIGQWIQQGAQNLVCQDAVGSTGTCDVANVTYAQTVAPIMQKYCTGCHSGTSASAGIDLSAYAGVSAQARKGSLYGSITHASGYSAMPSISSKIPACSIEQIRVWIDKGALNN